MKSFKFEGIVKLHSTHFAFKFHVPWYITNKNSKLTIVFYAVFWLMDTKNKHERPSPGSQAASQPAQFQKHLDPFQPQVDPLYWLLIKGLGRSDSEGAPKGLAAGRDWR